MRMANIKNINNLDTVLPDNGKLLILKDGKFAHANFNEILDRVENKIKSSNDDVKNQVKNDLSSVIEKLKLVEKEYETLESELKALKTTIEQLSVNQETPKQETKSRKSKSKVEAKEENE